MLRATNEGLGCGYVSTREEVIQKSEKVIRGKELKGIGLMSRNAVG